MPFQVHGVNKLMAEFDRLAQEPNKEAGMAAARAGATTLAKVYRSHAPTSELSRRNRTAFRQDGIAIDRTPMKQAVGTRVRRGRGKKGPQFRTGFNVGRKGRRRAPHAHLVILGTSVRQTRSGENRGRMPGRPGIGSAVNSAIPKAIAAMRTRLKEKLKSR